MLIVYIQDNSNSLQVLVMMSYQVSNLAETITRPTNIKFHNYVFPILYTIFDALIVLICLPLINNLILPCFPSLSMKKRLGFGLLLNIATSVSAAYVQWGTGDLDSEHILLWLLIPGTLLSVGELFIFVTGKY